MALGTGLVDRRAVLLGGTAALLAGCGREPMLSAPPPSASPVLPGVGAAAEPAPAPARQSGAVRPSGEPAFPLILDTANRLTPASASALAALGAQTVFRYYDHEPSSIRGKRLEPAERDAIFAAGMSVAAVFQHYNNCHLTFANGWGADDAARALALAELNDQPEGSAIYFGVDGDWPYGALLDDIVRYFEDVNRVFAGSGIDIGVYGGGCALETLRTRGLARYFWLSGSTGFTGTQAFYNRGGWTLFQNQLDIQVRGSVGIDTNIANPATGGYFGQFGPRGARAAAHDAAETARRFAERRLTARATVLRAGPSSSAARVLELRQHANVAALAPAQAGFTPVLTQEGGDSRRANGARGWVATADLRSMERFAGDVTSFGICGTTQAAPASNSGQNCGPAGFRRR